MKLFFTTLLLSICLFAHADYLIVQRNGNMRAGPSTSDEILEKIHTGDTLLLIDAAQTDGYYHVKGKLSGQEGWVYRTAIGL